MENMVICSKCNNLIESTQKFCRYCGQPVQQETNQNINQNQNQNLNQNQYQFQYQNQYPSQNQQYGPYGQYAQSGSFPQGYGTSGTQAPPQAFGQTQTYNNPQLYQQAYGNQVPVYYDNRQYPSQQPVTSAWGDNQVKKKSNKKAIGIVSTIAVIAVLAVVFFVFILPNLGRSPEKTAEQMKKAIMTGDEELARDCFDDATLQMFSGSILGSMDIDMDYMESMAQGLDLDKYIKIKFDVLQVYDSGLPKDQCVVVVEFGLAFENMPQELQYLVDLSGGSHTEKQAVAMIKDGSKWKFSYPLTEQLSDYIDMINE
ncbi:MAG TPA: zinc ribbon domain-containing protein [Clostridiaceae bacterium]|nr:zinc ribbon domain-containing protein [Clostridiaceae bacterium]